MHPAFTTLVVGSLSLLAHAFPSNIDSSGVSATLSKRYAPGWCGVQCVNHPLNASISCRLIPSSTFSVIQYQKNKGPGDQSVYRFVVTVKDAHQSQIGDVTLPSPASVDSALPYVLTITAGNVDSDPVLFGYAGQSWASDGQVRTRPFPSLLSLGFRKALTLNLVL